MFMALDLNYLEEKKLRKAYSILVIFFLNLHTIVKDKNLRMPVVTLMQGCIEKRHPANYAYVIFSPVSHINLIKSSIMLLKYSNR